MHERGLDVKLPHNSDTGVAVLVSRCQEATKIIEVWVTAGPNLCHALKINAIPRT